MSIKVGASDYRDMLKSASPSPTKTRSPTKSPSSEVGGSSLEERRNAIAGAECIALKCEEKGCQFVTAWDSEMQRHLAESHTPDETSPVRSRKPLPMLIPLSPGSSTKSSNSVGNGSSTTLLKVPRVRVRPELARIARDTEMAKLYGNREVRSSNSTRHSVLQTRNYHRASISLFLFLFIIFVFIFFFDSPAARRRRPGLWTPLRKGMPPSSTSLRKD